MHSRVRWHCGHCGLGSHTTAEVSANSHNWFSLKVCREAPTLFWFANSAACGCFSCFLPQLRGIHSPKHCWLRVTTPEAELKELVNSRRSKSPPQSTAPKSPGQKTGSWAAEHFKMFPSRPAGIPRNPKTQSGATVTNCVLTCKWAHQVDGGVSESDGLDRNLFLMNARGGERVWKRAAARMCTSVDADDDGCVSGTFRDEIQRARGRQSRWATIGERTKRRSNSRTRNEIQIQSKLPLSSGRFWYVFVPEKLRLNTGVWWDCIWCKKTFKMLLFRHFYHRKFSFFVFCFCFCTSTFLEDKFLIFKYTFRSLNRFHFIEFYVAEKMSYLFHFFYSLRRSKYRLTDFLCLFFFQKKDRSSKSNTWIYVQVR